MLSSNATATVTILPNWVYILTFTLLPLKLESVLSAQCYDDLCCLKGAQKEERVILLMMRSEGWVGMCVCVWWVENGHASHHISKLFFILSCIHLILLPILLYHIHSGKSIHITERAWHEWWLKWIGWQSISKQASNREEWLTYLHSIKWMSFIQSVFTWKGSFWTPHIKKNVYIASNQQIFRHHHHRKFNRLHSH